MGAPPDSFEWRRLPVLACGVLAVALATAALAGGSTASGLLVATASIGRGAALGLLALGLALASAGAGRPRSAFALGCIGATLGAFAWASFLLGLQDPARSLPPWLRLLPAPQLDLLAALVFVLAGIGIVIAVRPPRLRSGEFMPWVTGVVVFLLAELALAASWVGIQLDHRGAQLVHGDPATAGGLMLLGLGLCALAWLAGRPEADEVAELRDRILGFASAAVPLIAVTSAVLAAIPIYDGLRRAQHLRAEQALAAKIRTVEAFRRTARDLSRQISTRTQARRLLQAYQAGRLERAVFERESRIILGDALEREPQLLGVTRLGLGGETLVGVGAEVPPQFVVAVPGGAEADAISGPFFRDGEAHVLVASGVYGNGKDRIGTDLILVRLQALVDAVAQQGSSRDFLVIGEGADARSYALRPGRLAVVETPGGVLEAVKPLPRSRVSSRLVELGGEHQLLAFGRLPESSWSIVSWVDTDVLYAAVAGRLAWVLIGVLLLSAAGAWGTFALVRPLLRRMSLQTEAFARQAHETTRALERATQAEDELREVHVALMHAMPGISRLDVEGRYEQVNEAYAAMLGFGPSELIGAGWERTVHPRNRAVARAAYQQMQQQGTGEFEAIAVRKDGSTFAKQVLMVQRCNEAGEPIGHHCFMRDISQRKQEETQRLRLEARMREAQKLESLGLLAGGVAHDFNNLLMAIVGNVGLARMDVEPDSPARQRIDRIERSARRAADLTAQLLAYSGKGQAEFAALDLTDLVEDTLELLEASVGKKVSLRYELARDLPAVRGDASQLRQVAMNLILNAADAIGEREGAITVCTRVVCCTSSDLADVQPEKLSDGTYVSLEVADTGSGIDPEKLDRIFDPFFTTKRSGRGLGLAVVHGIVRAHGGGLRVQSEPGRGSRFSVLLPASPSIAPTGAASTSEPMNPSRDATILIADDEEEIRDALRAILERAGFRVLVAQDGREALARFRRHAEIDVVLLDLGMPHLSGEETLAEMLRLRPEARVVLTSGYDQHHAANELVRRGAVAFLQKPYPPEQLLARLQEILGG